MNVGDGECTNRQGKMGDQGIPGIEVQETGKKAEGER